MRKILLFLYKIMYIFIPMPLFYDFGNLSFFYIKIEDYDLVLNNPSIPMPVGAIAFLISTIVGYVGSIVSPNVFRSVFPPAKLLIFYFLVVLPLALYSLFVSDLSLPRLVQLLLPIIFISLLSFPVFLKDRLDLLRNTFLSCFAFFNLHFFSILFNTENILNINSNYDFSSFYGVLIYQALITYPAVLSLYLFLTITMIYVARKEIQPSLRKYKYFAYYFLFILLYLLAASGRRAFLVEYISAFFIVLSFSFAFGMFNRFVQKKTIWYFVLFIILFLSFFTFYISTPLSERVLSSIEENTFDSGRVDILGSALDFFTSNLNVFFFGGGVKDVPGFHNFILDQIYRVGLVGLLSVYATMALLVKKFVRVNDIGTYYKYHRLMFVTILFASLFLQSMINASVSQPYYFVNFLVVTTFVYFVLFARSTNELQS